MKQFIATFLIVFIIGTYFKTHFMKNTIHEDILKYKTVLHNDLGVPKALSAAVKSFIIDAETYGVSKDRIFCLDSINICADDDQTYGETQMWVSHGVMHGQINIRESILKDSVGTKWVVYHELGHWYGLEHTHDSGIMDDGYSTVISPYITPHKFDVFAWDLFMQIRELDGLEKVDYKGIEE